MKENKLADMSRQFAIDIINLCTNKRSNANYVLINQLLKSGTSIGANIREACYASSKADFINKLKISLKECYETDYWLDIFNATNIIDGSEFKELCVKYSKIRAMLITSINTASTNTK